MDKNQNISLRDYYMNLRKGEKQKLLTWLNKTYGIVATTAQRKFMGYRGCHWSPLEEKVVTEVVRNESWRED